MAKQVTFDQAERKKEQAAALMERIGESDRADDFDDMSVDEYAEHRGLQLIANPNRRKTRQRRMATGTKLRQAVCESKGCVHRLDQLSRK
jgi:hypothetical protein